jgi:Protein of unknown function (DUF2505)
MSRSFDVLTESPASVEQVHAAFSREDYWLDRVMAFGDCSTLDSLIVEADGTVTVGLIQHLSRQLLPRALANLVPGDLKILHSEKWRPVGDGQVRGQVGVSGPAWLGSGRAEAWLVPAGSGSQLRFAATVEVKIPWLGGKLENSVAAQLADNIGAFQRFTAAWIAEHPSHRAGKRHT